MKMAGINFYAPVPRVRSESLPACPRPRDNGESLVRIDGLDARIRYAASYRAAGIACAPQGCWVREGVVPLLQQALGLLPEDYSLLIFDAYRPLAVQQALYEEYSALVRRSHPGIYAGAACRRSGRLCCAAPPQHCPAGSSCHRRRTGSDSLLSGQAAAYGHRVRRFYESCPNRIFRDQRNGRRGGSLPQHTAAPL